MLDLTIRQLLILAALHLLRAGNSVSDIKSVLKDSAARVTDKEIELDLYTLKDKGFVRQSSFTEDNWTLNKSGAKAIAEVQSALRFMIINPF